VLPQEVKLVWNDGPRIQEFYQLLEANGLSAGADGKGRSVWMAFGYVLAQGQCDVIALHDCDITTYTRELLARLVYPVASPNLAYEFCKGYYNRVTDRMHGRVTRLLITPLLRALKIIVGPLPYLNFMDSFRYARPASLRWLPISRALFASPAIGGWKSACSPKSFAMSRCGASARWISLRSTTTSIRRSPPKIRKKGF
jgi:hypothetical protein